MVSILDFRDKSCNHILIYIVRHHNLLYKQGERSLLKETVV